MSVAAHVAGFTLAATLLTITPGLDTAMVLRTAASEGMKRATMAGAGIAAGCLAWGVVVAVGLGILLLASELAYDVLRWAGAAYLVYLGAGLLLWPRRSFADGSAASVPSTGSLRWFARGFLTNILNPKVGVFYISFLPQFIPTHVNVPAMTILLTIIHAAIGIGWFGVLILATRPIVSVLRNESVVAWLDRITGGVFIAFGVRIAASARY